MRHVATAALMLGLGISGVGVGVYGQSGPVDPFAKGFSCYVEGAIPRCIQPVPLVPPSPSANSSGPGPETLNGAGAR
jgi:hypothetical protein